MMKKKLRILAIFTTILSLVLLTSYFVNDPVAKATGPYMTVHVLDTDDSGYIVQLPNGKTMLVDAGSSSEIQKVYNDLDALGITRIDYLVGTHEHSDHIANFNDIILSGKYTIGQVDFPAAPSPCDNNDCQWMLNAASTKGIPVRFLDHGDEIFPDTTVNGLTLKSFVFAPYPNDDYSSYYTPGSASYVNAYSMVFHIYYGGKQVLFTGDAMPATQDELIDLNPLLDKQIVTAPHHGYDSTTNDSFLDFMEAAGTEKLVIDNPRACGGALDFKDRLQTRGTLPYWSTDYNHDFYFQTDGTSWTASEPAEWSPGDPVNVNTNTCPAWTYVDDTSGSIAYAGSGWSGGHGLSGDYNGTLTIDGTAGDTASYTFTGTAVEVRLRIGPSGGYVDVYLDGTKVLSNFDTYSASKIYKQDVYMNYGLTSGSHTIQLYVKGTKNPAANNTYGMLDFFGYQ